MRYHRQPLASQGVPGTRSGDLTLPLLVLGGSLLLALAGCSALGPRLLKGERGSYNLALQYTNDEQLLLNVVRLRYRDTPVFLEVSSLSTQFAFEASTEAGAELNDKEGDLFTLGTAAVYATRPTVTYTPLQGEDFSQRLLSPLSLDTLMLFCCFLYWPCSERQNLSLLIDLLGRGAMRFHHREYVVRYTLTFAAADDSLASERSPLTGNYSNLTG